MRKGNNYSKLFIFRDLFYRTVMVVTAILIITSLRCDWFRDPNTRVLVYNNSSYVLAMEGTIINTGGNVAVIVYHGSTKVLPLIRYNDDMGKLVITSLVPESDQADYNAEVSLYGHNFSHVHVEENSPYIDAVIEY